MEQATSNYSVSPRCNLMGFGQLDGESTKIDATEQDVQDSDLSELSRQLGSSHSLRVTQGNEDEIDRTRVMDGNSAPVFGRFKEEPEMGNDKDALNVVLVGKAIKLKIKMEHENEDPSKTRFPFGQTKLVSNGISRLRGPGQRSIAAASSPYCKVIVNPSWETSKVYLAVRGEMMYLHLKETVFKVHRTVLLSKIPSLPLLYNDLEPEEADEHFLNEPLHNINLMIYWIYHECLPPIATIKRFGILEGTTWDPIELYLFAEKLRAFELMHCITKCSAERGC